MGVSLHTPLCHVNGRLLLSYSDGSHLCGLETKARRHTPLRGTNRTCHGLYGDGNISISPKTDIRHFVLGATNCMPYKPLSYTSSYIKLHNRNIFCYKNKVQKYQ